MGRKTVESVWGVRERFITEPVLIIPDLDKKIRVEVYVLNFAMEGVLSMKYKDKK